MKNIAQHHAQDLPLPVRADGIEVERARAEGIEAPQVFRHWSAVGESGIARDFFEQLRAPNQQISGEPADIESLNNQLKQFRVGNEQFEEQTAQAVSFHETNELIESCARIRCLRQPIQQERMQFPRYLSSPRRDVETPRATFKIS